MSVTITSSQRIGLISGTSVNFSAPVVPEVTTDDIYDSINPALTLTETLAAITSEKLIGTATIDGTTIGNNPIYTVPAGQILVPTRMVFFLTDIEGSGEVPALNVGWTATAYNELVDSTRDVTYGLGSGVTVGAGTSYVDGNTLTLVGGTHSVAATLTVGTVSGGGAVTAFTVAAPGTYTALPSNPVSVTGGAGSGFTLTATWEVSDGLLSDITDVGQILSLSDFTSTAGSAGADYTYIAAGQVLTVRIPFASTYDTYELRCLAFGFLTEL